MFKRDLRRIPGGAGMVFVLVSLLVLALPMSSSGQIPAAAVTVCQVTGSVSAPEYLEVQVSVDAVAAYLNQFPGSFVGSCPAAGGGGSSGGTTPLPSGAVTVCQVTGSASAPSYLDVQVSIDQVAAYLNQFPGSFVGSCPAAGGSTGGGTGGGSGSALPSGSVTICQVAGSADAPSYLQLQVTVDQLAAYLNQSPGSFVGACPAAGSGTGGGGSEDGTVPSGSVTVCRVAGSATAPDLAQLTFAVDRIAAFLNQNPGSFIGTCPGQGGTVTEGPGRILGFPIGAALTICQVTSNASVLQYVEANVAIERVAAFINQNPRSYVGLCPSSSDPNGTLGNEPLGYVTICRVTGDAASPLAAVTIRLAELGAYLTRAGTVVPGPTGGCAGPGTTPGGGGTTPGGGGTSNPGPMTQAPPSTTAPGKTSTIVVQTTPNTVVTASGAGVKESAISDKRGKATLKVKPKRQGIINVLGANARIVKRVGVTAPSRSGANLTG